MKTDIGISRHGGLTPSYHNMSKWNMSHTWMSHATHTNESCHRCKRVIPRLWMSHFTRVNESCHVHMNESCHTYEWVMSHKKESCPTYESVMWQIGEWHGIELCHTYHNMGGLDPMPQHVTHIHELWHIYSWDMSHIWMSHVTQKWVMSYVWEHEGDPSPWRSMSHTSINHVSYINESHHKYESIMSRIKVRHVTYMN